MSGEPMQDLPRPPKRLRAGDVIEDQQALLMAQATRPHAEPTSDVEINRSTTNGRYGFKVAVTARDPYEAFQIAAELARKADVEFPYTENGGGEKSQADKTARAAAAIARNRANA